MCKRARSAQNGGRGYTGLGGALALGLVLSACGAGAAPEGAGGAAGASETHEGAWAPSADVAAETAAGEAATSEAAASARPAAGGAADEGAAAGTGAAAATAVAGPLEARVEGETLVLRVGAHEARLDVGPDAGVALVDLRVDGSARAAWVSDHASASLYVLDDAGRVAEIARVHGTPARTAGGRAPSPAAGSAPRTRLTDLDGDGALELIVTRVEPDVARPRTQRSVFARSDGPFGLRESLAAPDEDAFALGRGSPLARALEAIEGGPDAIAEACSLGALTVRAASNADPRDAVPPDAGPLVALVTRSGGEAPRWTLRVASLGAGAPLFVAALPLGPAPADPARAPSLEVRPGPEGSRLIGVRWDEPVGARARWLRWDGALAPEGEARALASDAPLPPP